MNSHDHHIFHQPLQLQQPHHHGTHPSPPDSQPPQPQTNGHGRHRSLSLSPTKHTDLQQVVPQRVKSEQDLDLELLSELPVTAEGQKLIVRLDLRKLGSLNGPLLSRSSSAQDLTSSDRDRAVAGKRISLRQLPKRSEDARSTSDEQIPDSVPSNDSISKAPETANPTETPQAQVEVKLPVQVTSNLLTPSSEPAERIPSAETSSRRSSVSLDYSESQNMDADDDGDYMDTGSQAAKRRASSKTLPNPVAKKRTRSSLQGEAKKKESPIPKPPTPPPVKKKSSPKPK